MVPDVRFYFALFVLALGMVLAGAVLSIAQRARAGRAQQSIVLAQRDGYYCYGCHEATYAPLQECWYRTGRADVLAPLCLTCQRRYCALPISQQDVRGVGPVGPRSIPFPTGRRQASPLKW
jgi:hypothetical protein